MELKSIFHKDLHRSIWEKGDSGFIERAISLEYQSYKEMASLIQGEAKSS